jgi:phenylalanyl-tRNA synthetase beta chain
MTGPVVDASWHPERKEVETVDFFNIKGVVEALLERLHVVGLVQWERATDLPYHPGRSANVLVDGQSIGYVGELHPAVAMEFQLPDQRFCIAELDMEVLLKLWNPHFRIADLSAFTPIYEDLAFVVPQGVKAGELQEAILRVGQPLLRSVQLFDVYQGDQVEAGSVSLAYALTFQAMDRTLKDKDVAKIRQNIVREMEQAFGARLR